MSTYREAYETAAAALKKHSVPDADVDAWYLLEHSTGMKRAEYFLKTDEVISDVEEQNYKTLIQKRCERIPLQYLTGVQEFMGLMFHVSPATLIPRQDTELLVEEAGKYAKGRRVLDLCTGTGCILLSLAKLYGTALAVGTDISGEALETAKQNASELDISAEFYCGDLFLALPEQNMKFDMIVSNPPYICTKEIADLMPEVKDHEPVTALDGDTDGLKFYRRIVKQAPEYLSGGGRLLFEIGCEQSEAVETLMAERGFTEIKTKKDYAGLDRVVSGLWRSK